MKHTVEAIDQGAQAPLPACTAIVQLDASAQITYCNSLSRHLVLGENPIGRPLPIVLGEAEKFGRIPIGTCDTILGNLSQKQSRFELSDGRSVLMNCSKEDDGAVLIEWWEVSGFVAAARASQQDAVTGLPSRAAMTAQIAAFFASNRQDSHGAVLVLYVDRLQNSKEMLSQTTVDRLLKKIAGRITGHVKAKGHAARLDGESFAVFVDARTQSEAVAQARTLNDLLSRPYIVDGQMLHVGTSVGIALVSEQTIGPDDLIRNATLALLRARQDDGDGAFGIYTEDLDEQVRRRRALEVDLRQALALRELSLVYQPQYELDGDKLVGFEALVRWTHPHRGPISPGEFIPVAEEMGLITQMGEWILRTACREAATWPEPLAVSVNISPIQFRSPQIVATVTSALAAAGLPSSRLELEVTEGALLLNSGPIMETFQQLKALGVRFAMDDFGTGYSSLSYLQKFPFDKIKIDQSFVRALSSSPDSAAIVRSVSALGTSLGLTTIAEGVETEEQLRTVKEYGCLQVQGYLTGRPLDVETARALALANGR